MSVRQLLRSQWPVMMVVLIFAVAFLLAAENFWRRSALLIGIGVGVAAVLRLTLTEDRSGLLTVRSKGIDFVTMTLVATAMVYIAWTIDPLGTG